MGKDRSPQASCNLVERFFIQVYYNKYKIIVRASVASREFLDSSFLFSLEK